MNRYKLTPLEELQLEKKRLNEQRMISSQRLSYQLQYLSDNWGTMLTKGVSSSIKTKFSETLDNLTADGYISPLHDPAFAFLVKQRRGKPHRVEPTAHRLHRLENNQARPLRVRHTTGYRPDIREKRQKIAPRDSAYTGILSRVPYTWERWTVVTPSTFAILAQSSFTSSALCTCRLNTPSKIPSLDSTFTP